MAEEATNQRVRRRVGVVVLTLLALPILLHVYQPHVELGGFGLALGVIGMTISPLILFGILLLWARSKW